MEPIQSISSPKRSPRKVTDLSSKGVMKMPLAKELADSKALILDGNEIQDIEHLDRFPCLEKLSLAHNRISSMEGMQRGFNIKVLDLQNNGLTCINCLENLHDLAWLNLAGNRIQHVSGLRMSRSLRHLDLSDNCISSLDDISSLTELKTLLLHGNMLSSLSSVVPCLPPSILILSLAENQLADLSEVCLLRALKELEQLSIMKNPCTTIYLRRNLCVNYRPFVLAWCGSIRSIDGIQVSGKEIQLMETLGPALKTFRSGEHNALVSYLASSSTISEGADSDFGQLSAFKSRTSAWTEVGLTTDMPNSTGAETDHDHAYNESAALDSLSMSNASLLDSESLYLPVLDSSSVRRPADTKPVRVSAVMRDMPELQGLSWSDIISRYQDSGGDDRSERRRGPRENASDGGLFRKPVLARPRMSRPSTADPEQKVAPADSAASLDVANAAAASSRLQGGTHHRDVVVLNVCEHSTSTSPSMLVSSASKYIGRKEVSAASDVPGASYKLTHSDAATLLNLAATVIQARVRGYLQRQKYLRDKRKFLAAQKIQAVWRGHYTRHLNVRLVQQKHEFVLAGIQQYLHAQNMRFERCEQNWKKEKQLLTEAVACLWNEVKLQESVISGLVAEVGVLRESQNKLQNGSVNICPAELDVRLRMPGVAKPDLCFAPGSRAAPEFSDGVLGKARDDVFAVEAAPVGGVVNCDDSPNLFAGSSLLEEPVGDPPARDGPIRLGVDKEECGDACDRTGSCAYRQGTACVSERLPHEHVATKMNPRPLADDQLSERPLAEELALLRKQSDVDTALSDRSVEDCQLQCKRHLNNTQVSEPESPHSHIQGAVKPCCDVGIVLTPTINQAPPERSSGGVGERFCLQTSLCAQRNASLLHSAVATPDCFYTPEIRERLSSTTNSGSGVPFELSSISHVSLSAADADVLEKQCGRLLQAMASPVSDLAKFSSDRSGGELRSQEKGIRGELRSQEEGRGGELRSQEEGSKGELRSESVTPAERDADAEAYAFGVPRDDGPFEALVSDTGRGRVALTGTHALNPQRLGNMTDTVVMEECNLDTPVEERGIMANHLRRDLRKSRMIGGKLFPDISDEQESGNGCRSRDDVTLECPQSLSDEERLLKNENPGCLPGRGPKFAASAGMTMFVVDSIDLTQMDSVLEEE